jgi:predicted DNA-binding mobile mystery protein A
MDTRKSRLIREQIGARFRKARGLRMLSPPRKGWIRTVRSALGMSGACLGGRVGLSKQRIARIEEDEVLGNVTLRTMNRVAEALDCTFTYALIPCTSLDETLRKQAEKVAKSRLRRTSQTMRLEDQDISDSQKAKVLKREIETILNDSMRALWGRTDAR